MQIEKFSTYKILISERELVGLSHILWAVKYNTIDKGESVLKTASDFKDVIDEVLIVNEVAY